MISFREIFRVVRFSTFATISAQSGRFANEPEQLRWTVHSDLNRVATAGRLCMSLPSMYVAPRGSGDCNMRVIRLSGFADRDRHAVERPTSRGVGSRSGLHATSWSEALV